VCVTARADAPEAKRRLTPAEVAAWTGGGAPPPPANATSGVSSVALTGDPTKPGLYTIKVTIAPHTRVRPHTHRDNRAVVVMSGSWSVGYGAKFDAAALKELLPGSFLTEPAGQPHFAQSGDQPVIIWVTGYGPSDTKFVAP